MAVTAATGCKKAKKDEPTTKTTEPAPRPASEPPRPVVVERIPGYGKFHGAVAVDDTGGWGYAYDQPTEAAARAKATEKCPRCAVRMIWRQGCGAIAQSDAKKQITGTGHGATRASAEAIARSQCIANGGGACSIAAWACNSAS